MEPAQMPRRLIATTVVASVALIAFAGIAPAAGKPKRGTYIDTALQVYIVTTKDVSAIKSIQAPCLQKTSTGATVGSGSMTVSRKIRLNGKGGFSYTGNARISTSNSKPEVARVTVKARYSGGRYKGTATFPAKFGCEVTTFSAKYFGVNPQG
jgi:hypothetical protein